MIDKGQWRKFGQDAGVTPLLFTMSVMGFLMTTESQDLGLTITNFVLGRSACEPLVYSEQHVWITAAIYWTIHEHVYFPQNKIT